MSWCLVLLLLPAGQDPDPAKVKKLVEQLADPDWVRQAEAAKALRDMGPGVRKFLEEAEAHPNEDVRLWSARILRALDEKAESSREAQRIADAVQRLESKSVAEQIRAAEELLEIGAPALPALREGLKKPAIQTWCEKLIKEIEAKGAEKPASGAPFAFRVQKKQAWLKRAGGDAETERRVRAALGWLARHQDADGSWSVAEHPENPGRGPCPSPPGNEGFRPHVTAAALLAFLGAGFTPASTEPLDGVAAGPVVKKALMYLTARQEADGRIGSADTKEMLFHLMASLALVEAYGLTGEGDLRVSAEKALDYALKGQSRTGGWRYRFQSPDSDTSVSGWGVMLLRAADLAGFRIPGSVGKAVIGFYDSCFDEKTQKTGYLDKRIGKVVIDGVNNDFHDHPTSSAYSALARLWIKRDSSDPRARSSIGFVLDDPPNGDNALSRDFYYWFVGGLAAYHFDGPHGAGWKRWNERLKAALARGQNREGNCRAGSWDPSDRWGPEGGRVYTTALGALALEVYYRYPHPRLDRSK